MSDICEDKEINMSNRMRKNMRQNMTKIFKQEETLIKTFISEKTLISKKRYL